MLLHDLPVYDPEDAVRGCKLITSAYVRDLPMVKTCIYVQSLLVSKQMKEAGAVEVVYHWKGSITECSRSNLFFVTPEGTLVTPKDGMLHGITRKQVLALAEAKGIPVDLREVHLEELPWFSEVFLTSSTRGVLPIIKVGDQVIANGAPGPMTMALQQDFIQAVQRELKTQLVS
jgi:D-alanine transaminase/branched-chain amino acid aminotransferase